MLIDYSKYMCMYVSLCGCVYLFLIEFVMVFLCYCKYVEQLLLKLDKHINSSLRR